MLVAAGIVDPTDLDVGTVELVADVSVVEAIEVGDEAVAETGEVELELSLWLLW